MGSQFPSSGIMSACGAPCEILTTSAPRILHQRIPMRQEFSHTYSLGTTTLRGRKKGQEFPALRLLRLAEIARPVEASQERPQPRRRLELADRSEFFERRREGV